MRPPYWPSSGRPRTRPSLGTAAARAAAAPTSGSSTTTLLRGRARRARCSIPDELASGWSTTALANVGIDAALRAPGEALLRARSRGRRSSRPAPHRASRCAFSCRRSRCSSADPHARGRCTSTRPRRSRRIRRARCTRSACTSRSGPRSTTATRRARSAPAIRKRSNLIITNPDMLHVGILPHHAALGRPVREPRVRRRRRGARLPRRVRLARRQRAAAAAPRRGDPRHRAALPAGQRDDRQPGRARRAAHRPAPTSTWSTGDGAPRAEPPGRDVEPAAARRGARDPRPRRCTRPPRCSRSWSAPGARTICFMKSRKGVELILRHARRPARARARRADRARTAAATRRQQRHEIQRRLSAGELLGVVATDALELGIDIGELDAAICVTFPGTVASLRQMWGRAGRRGRGLAVYIAGEDALDQFFCAPPRRVPAAGPSRRRSSTRTARRSTASTCCAPRTRRR